MHSRRLYRLSPFQVLGLVALAASLLAPVAAGPAEERLSVAVLPFSQLAPRAEDEYLQAGFADTLTTALARVRSLQVVERSHLKRILDEQKLQQSGLVDDARAAQIGKLAGARHVVVGSFIRAGNTMRVNCRFVETESGAVDAGHTATVTRKLAAEEEIFGLLDALAEEVVKGFGVTATPQEKQQIQQVAQATRNTEAFQFYTQAREKYLLATVEGWKPAVELFRKAVDTDPKYAMAWAGLAESLRLLAFQDDQRGQDPGDRYERALEAARKAIALDPKLSDGHRALAAFYLNRGEPGQSKAERKRRCEESARKAITLNDRDAEAYLVLWEAIGRPLEGEGFSYVEKCLEIDPNLVVAHNDLGNRYAMAGRFDEALRYCKKAVELSPRSTVALSNLAGCYLAQGRIDEAERIFRQVLELEPGVPFGLFGRALVLEKQGEIEEAVMIYQGLMQAHPRYPETYMRIGGLMAQMGNVMGAAQALQMYVRLADHILGAEESVAMARQVLQRLGIQE